MESAHVAAAPPTALERPAISSPRNRYGERTLRFYMGAALLLIAALFAVMLFPALASVWWHARNEGRFVWRETSFALPQAWSVVQTHPASRDEVTMLRRSWFVFAGARTNHLVLSPPNPKMYLSLDDELRSMDPEEQPVTSFSRAFAGRNFHCLSQPAPASEFSLGGAQIHAHCDLEGPGWELEYYGSAAFLDEGLEIVARGKPADEQQP
jgi:hypothetical protein